MNVDRRSGSIDLTCPDRLRTFRERVDAVAEDLRSCERSEPDRSRHIADTLHVALRDEPIASAIAAAHPASCDPESVIDGIIQAALAFQPTSVSSARDLPAMLRVRLLTLLDNAWWRDTPLFATNQEVREHPALVNLVDERRRGGLHFDFRTQVFGPAQRAVRSADRRLLPHRSPRTSGMRLPYARTETVEMLNSIADEFAERAPGAPRLWVNSALRSLEYQEEMRSVGYLAASASAHCVGWAADIEMAWIRRRGHGHVLAEILVERAGRGQLNLIDEGQAWHICLSPTAVAALED